MSLRYTKFAFSASTNGRQILIAATVTTGTPIHTAIAGITEFDEVWIYAQNSDSSEQTLTIEWGGVIDPGDTVKIIVPVGIGLVTVIPGWVMNGGLLIAAFASLTNVISVGGFVNRITP